MDDDRMMDRHGVGSIQSGSRKFGQFVGCGGQNQVVNHVDFQTASVTFVFCLQPTKTTRRGQNGHFKCVALFN